MTALSRVERVLGPSASRGPFELLGLPREPHAPETVREAARRRLARLTQTTHDPLDIVETQEAIAHAEALLANLDIQRALLETKAGNRATPDSASRAQGLPAAAVDAARVALAAHGGWNARAASIVAAIAAQTGSDPRRIVAAARPAPRSAPRSALPLAPPARGQAVPPMAPRGPAPIGPGLSPDAEMPSLAPATVAAAAAVALSAIVLLTVALWPAPAARPPAQDAAVATAPLDEQTFEAAVERDLRAAAAGELATTAAIADAASAAVRAVDRDPAEAAWRLEEALVAIASRWTDAAPAQRDRIVGGARTFLTKAAPDGAAAERVARAIVAPLGEAPPSPLTAPAVRALVWSAGAAAAIAQDPDVPAAARDLLQTAAGEAPSFDAGAREGLRTVAAMLATASARPQPPAWDAWLEMLDLLTSDRALARARQNLVLETLESILLSAAPPSRDGAAMHAARGLIARAGWDTSRAAVARERFLAWLDDPRVSSIDLAILMRQASLPELAAVELSPSAAAAERDRVRARLAEAWGLEDAPAPRERFIQEWHAARERAASIAGSDAIDRLRRTLAHARLAAAASSLWESQLIVAGEQLASVGAGAELESGAIERPPGTSADGRWTVEYYSVRRNGDLALEALERVARRNRLGPIDSRTLGKLALYGSPPEVRRRAQQLAGDRAENVHLLEGVLEQLPAAPRTPRTAELIDRLTNRQTGDVRDDGWPLRARRAMTERLLVALDAHDAPAHADTIARAVRDAFVPPHTRAGAPPADAAAAIAQAADQLIEGARAIGVPASVEAAEIARRRDGRRRVATGPVQRAVAEAGAVAEALAAIVGAERPERSSSARQRIDDLQLLQRRARTSVEQLEAAIAAIADLWGLRLAFPEGAPGGRVMLRGDAISRLLATMAIASAPESLAGAALESRLAALEPDQPEAYLRLAEELAYEASSRESTQLARRLALLAMSLADPDRSPVPASAALLLADLSPDAERRGWLRALADSLGASAGLLRWNVGPRESFEARLAAAEVLGLARAEENREAMDRFEQPAVHAALETVAVALPGGLDALAHRLEHAPSCPECKNERVVRSSRDPTEYVLCYTCRGLPRPYISDQALVAHLRAERYLLGEEHDWAVAIAARGLEPLRDLTLAEAAAFYGVDLSETIYRSGRWRAPGEAPTSP